MGRRKKGSPVYDKAVKRMAAIQSIDPNFDLGNGLSFREYQSLVNELRDALDHYNTILSTADEKLNLVNKLEEIVANMNERMLVGVAAKYGKDSSEYEQAGGRKKSDIKRKRVVKKTA